jgi:hypothetical protein
MSDRTGSLPWNFYDLFLTSSVSIPLSVRVCPSLPLSPMLTPVRLCLFLYTPPDEAFICRSCLIQHQTHPPRKSQRGARPGRLESDRYMTLYVFSISRIRVQ